MADALTDSTLAKLNSILEVFGFESDLDGNRSGDVVEFQRTKHRLRSVANRFGYDIKRVPSDQISSESKPGPRTQEAEADKAGSTASGAAVENWHFDIQGDAVALEIIDRVRSETMTSVERIYATIQATRYVVQNQIPGALVECGVWRGGSSMAIALTLKSLGVTDRQLVLYDTFDGMTEPAEYDEDFMGVSAKSQLMNSDKEAEAEKVWAFGPLDVVRKNLESTGYPMDNVSMVVGDVLQTLPANMPWRVALLRLDTDWYESTRHELETLGTVVSPYGVLIIDDYGHWQGAKKAVDEWISQQLVPVMLQRTDYTGRIAIVPPFGDGEDPSPLLHEFVSQADLFINEEGGHRLAIDWLGLAQHEACTVRQALAENQSPFPQEWNAERETRELLHSLVAVERPRTVIETGVANGASTRATLAAMVENGSGHLISFDIEPRCAEVVTDPDQRKHWTFIHLTGSSKQMLDQIRQTAAELDDIDMWFHDSDHTYAWQLQEYRLAVETLRAKGGGILLSDDTDFTKAWLETMQTESLKFCSLLDTRKIVGLCRVS